MKKAARFILTPLLFVICYLLFVITPVSAQYVVQTNVPPPPNTNPNVPNNLHNWTQNVMIEVMLSLTCQLVGVDPTQPNGQCLGVDQKTGKIGFLPGGNLQKGEIGGAIGGMNNMITMLYTPPIHTSDYFQNLAQNFGIVKTANAQAAGTGFQGLSPLLNLWTAFRNIVYLIFVIVFVVIGLAIMLRIKIDPRTVMTIQNQIPKIIIGILLVTFSFAIAGFLVDLMWVVIYLVFGLISGISGDIAKNVAGLNPASLQGSNPFGAANGVGDIFGIANDAAGSVKDSLQSMLGIKAGALEIFNPFALITNWLDPTKRASIANWFIDIVSFVAGLGTFKFILDQSSKIADATKIPLISAIPFIGPAVNETLTTIVKQTGVVSAFTLGAAAYTGTEALLRNWLPYLIVYIIVFIALLMALFRLWFSLLMAYINILIDVVLAPFWIVGSLVPGSPVSAVGWLRDLIANLAAFPVVIAMFLLGKVFTEAFTHATNPFVPPLIGNPGETKVMGSLIGLGFILMTPNVVTMVKAALKAPKLDTGGIGASLKVGPAMFTGGFKSVTGTIAAARYNPLTGVAYTSENPEGKKGMFGRLINRFSR